MVGQPGFFDGERLEWLSAARDPLSRLTAAVDFENETWIALTTLAAN